MQRGDHDRHRLRRLRRLIKRGLHFGQILLHVGVRLVIAVAAQIGNQRLVAYADAEQEASAGQLRDGLRGGRHRDGVASIDVRDAGGDVEAAGLVEQVGRMRKWFAADRLRNPEGAVAELFDLLRELGRLRRSHRVEEKPQSNFSEFHSDFLSSAAIAGFSRLAISSNAAFPATESFAGALTLPLFVAWVTIELCELNLLII